MDSPPTSPAVPIPARAELHHRIVAATIAVCSLVILAISTQIDPSPAGHGTHTQLGLPACGWALTTDSPCPTCGMTTAFAHAVRGDLPAAFSAQPMGFLMALAAAVAFWTGLHVAATGSRLGVFYGRLLQPRVLWTLAGVAAASWAYKWVTWTGIGPVAAP